MDTVIIVILLVLLIAAGIGGISQAQAKSRMRSLLEPDAAKPDAAMLETQQASTNIFDERYGNERDFYGRLASEEADPSRRDLFLELATLVPAQNSTFNKMKDLVPSDEMYMSTLVENTKQLDRLMAIYGVLGFDGFGAPTPSADPKMRAQADVFAATESYLGVDGASGVAIDRKAQKLALLTPASREIVAFRDIVSSEVCVDGDTVARSDFGSLFGRAAVGAALFGGVGAIVGGVSGSKRSKQEVRGVDLKVLTKNSRNGIHTVCFFNNTSLVRASSAIEHAGHWHDLITVCMKTAADEPSKSKRSTGESREESTAAQLSQLAALHKEGIGLCSQG